ncbi:MAG: TonB-dependent receptor [Bacteroidales bacterium]|nr:TonB-dependent receptor [Bacteroidales bacterium]
MRSLIFTVFFLFFHLPLLISQTGTITGTVYDASSKKPLPSANITLTPPDIGDVTDSNGVFILTNLSEGTYHLVVSYVGYTEYHKRMSIIPGDTTRIDPFLAPETAQLNEIEVTDVQEKLKPYSVELISLTMLQETPAGDIGSFLRETPNISAIRKGGTNLDPVIRGFKFSQLNVQLNQGIRIEGGCPNRMDPATSHVDITDVREIRVYKGPYALRYGPNLGGILRISTAPVHEYTRFETHITAIQTFESNWNSTRSHLDVTGGNRYFFFDLSGNFNKAGNYNAGNGGEISSRFTQYNYSATVGITPAKNHTATVSFIRSFGRNVMFPALPMDERSDDTRILSVDYSATSLGKRWQSLTVSGYHSRVDHVMDTKERPSSDTIVAVSKVTAIDYGYRAEAGLRFGRHQVTAGTDYEEILKDGTRIKSLILQPNLPVKHEKLWDDAHIRNIGIFAEYQIPLGKVNLTGAVRVDFNDASCHSMAFYGMNGQLIYSIPDVSSSLTNFSISGGVRYIVTEKIDLRLSVGRSARSPDMVERFIMLLPIGYDDFDYLGNPQLKPEINNEADLAFSHNCSCSGSFHAGIFFSLVENYITGKEVPPSVVKPQTKGVAGVKQFINTDYVYLYGFECAYHTPDDWKLFGTAVISLTQGINPEATRYIIQNGQVTGEETIKNDPLAEIPPLEGTLTIGYKFLKSKLVPQATIRLVAAQNQLSQAYNEITTPGFVTAGLSLKYKYSELLTLNAGINNLFNAAYYEHLNRRIVGSEMPLYEPGRVFYATLIITL